MSDLLARLRANAPSEHLSGKVGETGRAVLGQIAESGVAFAASDPRMEARFLQAIEELLACIKPTADERAILNEGGIYYGCWLESTGTINTEILSRFAPQVAHDTFAGFARYQRDDGCLPYKLTADGPVFSQIQLVTPPARSVWTHVRLHGDTALLDQMYPALAAYDDWLADNRDTRGTGGVEAFCAFDTGHDLSSRFWHVPDSPHGNDPGQVRADHPTLPFVAPDLTAAVACSRRYLGQMSESLGQPSDWAGKAAASEAALAAQCWDAADGFWYDRDRTGAHVRVQSDVLLRVLACEIGDDATFDAALARYLLSTRKFFAKYPFTSLALDDPRFDPHFHYNSWNGPSNFLSLIRAPHAFEAHGRHVELSWALQPVLSALFRGDRFPQCLSPYTGEMGFTEVYSPAILCLLDYVERLSGILPRPEGELWFTGLVPVSVDHRDAAHETAYARRVDGALFELLNTGEGMKVLKDGETWLRAPAGLRLVTGRDGTLRAVTGLRVDGVSGVIETPDGTVPVNLGPNEHVEIAGDSTVTRRSAGIVAPTT